MTYLVTTEIPYFTAIAKDVITNTWHFNWLNGGTPSNASFLFLDNNVRAALGGCYANATTNHMAAFCNQTATVVTIYDLDDPVPRVPVYQSTGTLSAVIKATSTLIAAETSVCVSYKAAFISGIPKASQRGRIFLGGIADNWVDPGTGALFPKPKPGTLTALGNSINDLLATPFADDWEWVVYSRKLMQTFPVVGGWIDNAFDTQRRRGNAASTRTLW